MSYRTNSGPRSGDHDDDSGGYGGNDVPDNDAERLSADSPFLMEGLEATELPGGPLPDSLADPGGGGSAGGDLPGLDFALSERLDLLKKRIDTLLKETATRRRLHRTVQKAVQSELLELEHLLRDVKVWSLGVSPSVDSRRTNLEREAISLKKTGWEERLRHWRDLVWLEKEMQEALERYKLATAAQGLTQPEEDQD